MLNLRKMKKRKEKMSRTRSDSQKKEPKRTLSFFPSILNEISFFDRKIV